MTPLLCTSSSSRAKEDTIQHMMCCIRRRRRMIFGRRGDMVIGTDSVLNAELLLRGSVDLDYLGMQNGTGLLDRGAFSKNEEQRRTFFGLDRTFGMMYQQLVPIAGNGPARDIVHCSRQLCMWTHESPCMCIGLAQSRHYQSKTSVGRSDHSPHIDSSIPTISLDRTVDQYSVM